MQRPGAQTVVVFDMLAGFLLVGSTNMWFLVGCKMGSLSGL